MVKVLVGRGAELASQNLHKKAGQPVLITPVLGRRQEALPGLLAKTTLHPEDTISPYLSPSASSHILSEFRAMNRKS